MRSRPLESAAGNHSILNPNQQHVESLGPEEQEAWGNAEIGTEESELQVQLDSGRTVFMRTDGCLADARRTSADFTEKT